MSVPDPTEIEPTDLWRADTYALLAHLLFAPPQEDVLIRLRAIEVSEQETDRTPMTQAWAQLIKVSNNTDWGILPQAYQDLFIGITQGELLPYASWYQTGFLMEKPLLRLRDDLERLGIRRQSSTHEPEDHIAALCETMRLLILRGDAASEQRLFFERHLVPWTERFFHDLEQNSISAFYRAVGYFGWVFMQLEASESVQ